MSKTKNKTTNQLAIGVISVFTVIAVFSILFNFKINNKVPPNAKTYASAGNWVGQNNGKMGISCPASDDCKIVYQNVTNKDLMFADCNSIDCSVKTITKVPTVSSDDGNHLSIYCPSTDNCKITYFDNVNKDLGFFDCDNSTCSSGTNTLVDSSGTTGQWTSVFCPSSSDCKIAYRNAGSCGKSGNCDLKFADCDNETCSIKNITTIDNHASADYGTHTSVYCNSSTNCKVVHHDRTNLSLRFVSCIDGTDGDSYPCNASGERTANIVDDNSTTNLGKLNSIYCPTSDDCKISYRDETHQSASNDLKFADCADESCSSTGRTIRVLDGKAGCVLSNCVTGDIGGFTSISCLSADDCKIAYRSSTNDDLKFADCNDATCSTGEVNLIETNGDVSDYTQMYCLNGSDCKITYCEAFQKTIAACEDGNLKFTDCNGYNCLPFVTSTVDGT